MKRKNLHGIVSYTLVIMIGAVAPLFGQAQDNGSYVFQNFTLSDFGDGYDAAKSLVWKPKFSDFVAQVPGAEETVVDDGTGNEVVVTGANPDPERSAVRYTEGTPDGVTDIVAGSQKFVLGVKAQFTQQGYNWIELSPYTLGEGAQDNAGAVANVADAGTAGAVDTQAQASANADTYLLQTEGEVEAAPDPYADGQKFRIPFSGKATDITLWTWGGHYGWWLEASVRDHLGYLYTFPMGDLLYTGWKQKRIGIPNSVTQSRKRLPSEQSLEFEMLKLWSFPSERMDQFYVYFDLLQHGAIVDTDFFNGKELENQLW